MKRTVYIHEKLHKLIQKRRGELLINNVVELSYSEMINLCIFKIFRDIGKINDDDGTEILCDIISSSVEPENILEAFGEFIKDSDSGGSKVSLQRKR